MVALPIDEDLPRLHAPAERAAALDEVRRAAALCRDCDLWSINTQVVMGAGPVTARVMFIGEAPGGQEDKAGVPFVGPAGKLFQDALDAAGLTRDEVFISNTVKHRPWAPGPTGRQKNRPPKQSEVNACRQWRVREQALVRPHIICCLGSHAAREVLGKEFKLTAQRGQWQSSEAAPHVLATLHPSYVLIQPDASAAAVRDTFFGDVRAVAERYRQLG